LRSIYVDPNERRNTCFEYQILKIKISESFNDFYICFLVLANKSRIPQENRFADLLENIILLLSNVIILIQDIIIDFAELVTCLKSLNQT
jgi:hypothetical protein